MKISPLFAAVLLLAAATAPGIAASNDAPLADAGLDQTVTANTTVYLDAGGSRDPDGTISSFRWNITGVSGDAADAPAPDAACSTCEQTRFRPTATGTYRVTLEVTDDDGTTTTDALYVTVTPGEPPSVTLAGPTRTTTGDSNRFTVDVDAGGASLDRLVWTVDGDHVATTDLTGSTYGGNRVLRFASAGTHTVRVEVVDEDDQRDAAARIVDASPRTNGGGGGNDVAPDISGPRIVTGHGALAATYSLADGSTGTWMLDGAPVGTGARSRVSLDPGVHELYAATDDGVATFSDGGRSVVADPAPEIKVANVSDASVVPLDLYVTDDFGNLRSVAIKVDGDRVETLTTDRVGDRSAGHRLSTVEYLRSLDPGSHVVSVRARDGRGQVDTAVRTVDVPGPPEVVSAGFVEDGPINQYHPRLNASRYTATYRVKVKLNGVEPDRIHLNTMMGSSTTEQLDSSHDSVGESVIFKRNYKKESLGYISIHSSVWTDGSGEINNTGSTLRVSPAPPEIRLQLIKSQTAKTRRDGMVLDANSSFDPDNTALDFYWYDVHGGTHRDPVAPLDSFKAARLEIIDGQSQHALETNPIEWFVPGLDSATLENSGPFYPNETVTYSVRSNSYALSKPTYIELVSYGLSVPNGEVVKKSTTVDKSPDSGSTRATRVRKWRISVPAREFVNGTVTVSAYPTEHPVIERKLELPEPEVYEVASRRLENITADAKYTVRRPNYIIRRTADLEVKKSLLSDGYSVRKSSNSGKAYILEEYQKTRDAEYDVEKKTFSQSGERGYFLSLHPEWSRAGSETRTRTWTTTNTVWRSTRSGSGTFTGATRQRLVQQARYRTEHEYEYWDTVSYQDTVTYEDTWTTTRTHVEYEKQCTPYGCIRVGRTVRDTVYHSVTRTKTVTKTKRVKKTYWSERPRNPTHDPTGRTRMTKVRDAEYERQYEFEIERTHTESTRMYVAEKRTLVSPPEYDWVETRTVYSQLQVEVATMESDTRISEVTGTTKWTLEKRDGTEVVSVWNYVPQGDIIETTGIAEGALVKRFQHEDGTAPVGLEQRITVNISLSKQKRVPPELIKSIAISALKDEYDA